MATICNGIALHGGIFVACGTFFVFSDYMKPAVRLAALMQVPVKYIWSHDAFRVGEDGPTHQPIEQEAQIRLLEKVRNHAGDMSLLALRPCLLYTSYYIVIPNFIDMFFQVIPQLFSGLLRGFFRKTGKRENHNGQSPGKFFTGRL